MIVVTRLNDSQFAINPDLIERIHSNPDTTLVMVDGAKYIVTESMSEVIERIACYRARVIALAHSTPVSEQPHSGWQLGLVPEASDSAASVVPATIAVEGAPGDAAAPPAAAVPLRPRKM